MAGRVWKGRGGMVEGVAVRFATQQIRVLRPSSSPWGTPHPYGSPAADLKRDAERERAEQAAARTAEKAGGQPQAAEEGAAAAPAAGAADRPVADGPGAAGPGADPEGQAR